MEEMDFGDAEESEEEETEDFDEKEAEELVKDVEEKIVKVSSDKDVEDSSEKIVQENSEKNVENVKEETQERQTSGDKKRKASQNHGTWANWTMEGSFISCRFRKTAARRRKPRLVRPIRSFNWSCKYPSSILLFCIYQRKLLKLILDPVKLTFEYCREPTISSPTYQDGSHQADCQEIHRWQGSKVKWCFNY